MAYKVFIDGQAGTTGLRLAERLAGRADIELAKIPGDKRKDIGARLSCIAEADISVLCLPDDGAREIALAVDEAVEKGGPGSPLAKSRIIDCSTAHRTAAGWVYGMPEIGKVDESAMRVSNPGCHATGYIMALRPLVDAGIVDPGAAMCFFSLTGYSGGGKPMIAQYEAAASGFAGEAPAPGNGGVPGLADEAAAALPAAPRLYALSQGHKHIPEMREYSGLKEAPVFSPAVCGFYSGMLVCVPLPRSSLRRPAAAERIRELLSLFYEGCPLVKVRPAGYELAEAAGEGYLSAAAFSDRDDIEILVTGKDDKIEIVARYDNLGKGASGAAIQNMNLMLGLPETRGLILGS